MSLAFEYCISFQKLVLKDFAGIKDSCLGTLYYIVFSLEN